ncbi:MAG: ABC transporter permease, partial [Puniceicoccales bacterium]
MMGYIAKRLLLMVPVLFAVTLIIFLLMKLVPGDAAEAMLGPYATPENVERLREEMHLNESVVVQYFSWLGGLVQGDMGTAYSIDRPVRAEVLERFGATLILAGAA